MTPYEKLEDLTRLGANWQLHHDKRPLCNKNMTWYFKVDISQDGATLAFSEFHPTMDKAVDAGYDAIMKIAQRGIDLKRLAAPTVEHAPPAKPDLNDDIRF